MMLIKRIAASHPATKVSNTFGVSRSTIVSSSGFAQQSSLVMQLQQQARYMSFFSNLFGIQPKRLEKPTEEDKVAREVPEKTLIKTATKAKAAGKASNDIKLRKSLSLQEERIIGGNYPVRGPAIPEKRLREWSHTVENLSIVPKKLNLVAKLVRKLPVPEARLQLRFSKKAISRDVLLALDQACMKARALGDIHLKDLIVGQCYVGGKIIGHKLDIKARGKSGRITKKASHLNIVLYENPALVEGFQSKTLTPEKYLKEKRAAYHKKMHEEAKAAANEPKGTFKVIA